MASSSDPLNEELQCSICLDVFTDPVTTPCGHNFCRTCLNKCWTNTQTCCCPLCKEKFSNHLDLEINTTLRKLVQHFKKVDQEKSEVFCDFCDEKKQKTMKSCLTCQSSYCETHLEPHHRVPRLKKHKLINAVNNLEDYICQKHQRPLELFCRDDQTCVCLSCTEGDHRNHNTVPIEEESQQKTHSNDFFLTSSQTVHISNWMNSGLFILLVAIQFILPKQYTDSTEPQSCSDDSRITKQEITDLIRSIEINQSELLKMMEEQQKAAEKQAEDLIKELQQEITDLKRNTEEEKSASVDLFTGLIHPIERRQSELLKMIEEQQKAAAEKQAGDLIKELQQEITDLKRRETEKEKSVSVELFTDLIHPIERRQSELLKMMKEQQKAEKQAEDLIKELQQEITDLKRRETEKEKSASVELFTDLIHPIERHQSELLKMMEEQQKAAEKQAEDLIKELQLEMTDLKRNTEEKKSASVELFTDLIHPIERRQSELLKMMEEQQKAAEKQAEDLIKKLQQEITDLKKRNTELEQLSHTDDHLHLIQVYSSLYSLLHTKNWIDINTDVDMFTLKRALTFLKEHLNEKLSQTGLKWAQKFAVDVTLDPDTANPYLILSDDGKQVSEGDIKQDVPENPKRFDVCLCVLAKEGFSSGRFYCEVQVKGKTEWDLGVARESINRKGLFRLNPVNGFWTVALRNDNQYIACENPSVSLSLKVKPEKVGVFVDYEEGLVSFYDVGYRSHIYTFTGQTFTDTLYSYFSPGLNDESKNSNPLIITPVS